LAAQIQVLQRASDTEFTPRRPTPHRGVIMQISEAARSHAGAMANACAPAQAQRSRESAASEGGRRDLDSQAAGRVFAAEVLRQIAVVNVVRVESPSAQPLRPQPAQPDPVAAVAGALRTAVAGAKPSAGDPVPQLLRDVDAGIASASKTLEQMGYNAGQVAAAAARFRESVGASLDTEALRQPPALEGAAVSASHVRKTRGSIELVTQDGDVVRVRFRSRDSERVDVAGVQSEQGSALNARIATRHNVGVKVAVHGDLDAAERKAIEDFLGAVDTLASDFYGKDPEAAFAAAANLEVDPQEIARYAVKLSLNERYEVQAQVQGQPPASQPAPSAPSAASAEQAPQAPASSVPAAQASAPAAQVVASSSAQSSVQPAAPAQDSEAATPNAPVAPPAAPPSEGGLDKLHQFLQNTLSHTRTPVNLHGIVLQWSVRIELTAALLEAASPDATPGPGADLLANVLDGAAIEAADTPAASIKAAA
jgi:hypothetical protein